MKLPLTLMITMSMFVVNVSSRLYCKCCDIPLADQRTPTCCEAKQTKGTLNDETGICQVNTSSGKAEKDFVRCCNQGLTGIYGYCEVDKWKGGEENKDPSGITDFLLSQCVELTSDDSPLGALI